jgi:hypothetical protein
MRALKGESPAPVVTAAQAAHAAELLAKRRKGRPQAAPASTPQRLTLATLKEAAKRKLQMGGA